VVLKTATDNLKRLKLSSKLELANHHSSSSSTSSVLSLSSSVSRPEIVFKKDDDDDLIEIDKENDGIDDEFFDIE
jgi:hypothetical protein